jgi:SHS2 domain-containing protein
VRRAPPYEFVDRVTSDLCFVAHAPDLPALFEAAAEALLAATLADPASVAASQRRPLSLEEPDLDLLMLRFLNELVYLRDAEGLLLRARALRIEAGPPARLEAELVGEPLDPARHRTEREIKAATAHGLRVAGGSQGWDASVTLDV